MFTTILFQFDVKRFSVKLEGRHKVMGNENGKQESEAKTWR
ncbi:hypothetical protein [Listeria monocytogenes]|nr:hypothetical protein [Listeria monocytogenes]